MVKNVNIVFNGKSQVAMINIEILPVSIKQSKILTTNNLHQLCSINEIPSIAPAFGDDRLKQTIQYYSINPDEMETELHKYAAELLNLGKIEEAWQVLLTDT